MDARGFRLMPERVRLLCRGRVFRHERALPRVEQGGFQQTPDDVLCPGGQILLEIKLVL